MRFLIMVSIVACLVPWYANATGLGTDEQTRSLKTSGKVFEIIADESDEPPRFIKLDTFGFFTAVGVPYDLYFTRGAYYLNRDSIWYRASSYQGPWIKLKHEQLPAIIRRHDYRDVLKLRDEAYERCRQDEGYFRDRSFTPARSSSGKSTAGGRNRPIKQYGEN